MSLSNTSYALSKQTPQAFYLVYSLYSVLHLQCLHQSLLAKCKKNRSSAPDKKELSSTLMGFKTAVQKAAFKHEQVFFPSHLQLNKCDFRLLRLSLSLSPSLSLSLSLPTSSSSPPLFPLVFFTCKSQSCTRYAGRSCPPRCPSATSSASRS